MTLAEVRSRLTTTLAGRSEPVVALGDHYVPAAALYTGARRRVRRADLGVADDVQMLEFALAEAWRGRLEMPPLRLSSRRSTVLSAVAWPDAAACWADVAEHLLGGALLLVRPTVGSAEEIADLLRRWRPDRAHLSLDMVHSLGASDQGRAALVDLRERDPHAARRAAGFSTVA
jgi:hypothetical protein